MSEKRNSLVFQKQKLINLASRYVPPFLPCPRMVLTIVEVENKMAFLNMLVLIMAYGDEKVLNK